MYVILILIFVLVKRNNQKNGKIKYIDLSFFFFFLSSFAAFVLSFLFLLACSDIGNNQVSFVKTFVFINIFCSVLTILSLFIFCMFDFFKFTKNFAFFKKIGLSAYIFSIITCLTISLFNGFFMKILFQIKIKNDFSIAEGIKYKNFFNFAMINFVFVLFLFITANILQLKARKNIFCFNGNQSKKSSIKKNDKSQSLSH